MRAAELSMAVPQVVALRTARMLAAGASPDARDRRELARMGTEKVQAYWESVNAMALQTVKMNQELALIAMRQWWSGWASPWSAMLPAQRAAARVLEQGLVPVHRAATANARRLGRARKRR